MRIASPPSFLVLQYSAGPNNKNIRIVDDQAEVLKEWRSSTRLSPIFGVKEHGTDVKATNDLRKTRYLIFIGPVHPELISERIGTRSRLWLTLGLFNVIVATNFKKERKSLLEWVQSNQIPFEAWTLEKGNIVDSETSQELPIRSSEWRIALAKLSQTRMSEELQDVINEYCPLMASTLARSERTVPAFIKNLEEIQESVLGIFNLAPQIAPNDAQYVMLGQLLTINAGLSRFASQTFAGTSPISETECHFWSHSLLGIGVATMGLWKLREFLQRTIGEARIPSRLAELAAKPNAHDLTRLDATDEFWQQDHLSQVELSSGDEEPLIPLLTYFSARDAFKSVLSTISAPLATVAKCNSMQWSLNTMSHEISHVLIRGVLSDLYPNLRSSTELSRALALYKQTNQATTVLEEIQRLLFITIAKMESPRWGQRVPISNNEQLRETLEKWQREVEEIFVHVFDFLYFYGAEPSKYLTGIWLSWGTIPHINRRVREYVIRSVCAVLVKHLRRRGEAENQAREETLDILGSMPESNEPGSYLNIAVTLLKDNWTDDLQYHVLARKGLIKIARTFLFSSAIAHEVRGETELVGGTDKEKQGYPLTPGVIDTRRILNPMHFLELYTKQKAPSASESAWMFYILAFCIRDAFAE